MTAPNLPISDELAASVRRMCARTVFDPIAAAYETGEIETRKACRGALRQARHPMSRRRPQRTPDKQASYERRHRLAFSGVMPPALAARFTIGWMACMRIIADEVMCRGVCALSIDEIAARAGVCRKTVQLAEQAAKHKRIINVEVRPVAGKKNLPNIVTIKSKEWIEWLNRRTSKPTNIAGKTCVTTVTRSTDDNGGDEARASECGGSDWQPSEEAVIFAGELANIAGYRRDSVPASWQDANPARVVQVWLNELSSEGIAASWLPRIAETVMRRKPFGRPYSPRYFSPAVKQIVHQVKQARIEPLARCGPHSLAA